MNEELKVVSQKMEELSITIRNLTKTIIKLNSDIRSMIAQLESFLPSNETINEPSESSLNSRNELRLH